MSCSPLPNDGARTHRPGPEPTPLAPERVLASLLASGTHPGAAAPGHGPGSDPSRDPEPASLLRVLAYSYATGVYASSEIEAALDGDPILRYLAGGHRPEPSAMRRFRRRNRHALQRCLAQTLENSWTGRKERPELGQPTYAQDALERWAKGPTRPDFETEAADRVRRAICDDTALLDE